MAYQEVERINTLTLDEICLISSKHLGTAISVGEKVLSGVQKMTKEQIVSKIKNILSGLYQLRDVTERYSTNSIQEGILMPTPTI